MKKIRFSPQAKIDLKEIRKYITNELCSSKSAERTVSRIMKRIRSLAELPEIGAPLSSIVDVETDYRFLVCGNYIVFYQYENNIVHIARILYGRRKYVQILFGDTD